MSEPFDELVGRFRVASREIFNHWFRVPDPDQNDGWTLEERFSDIEVLLFEKLVVEPAELPAIRYGDPNPHVRVGIVADRVPLMVNRETDSGYWDFPVDTATRDAQLAFIAFFDWDQVAFRNNQYVRVRIDSWPSQPSAVGKQALIEAQHAVFSRA
jgi:hypothetical protein